MKSISSPPEPLRGVEANTWANSTILTRFPDILERTIHNNHLPPPALKSMRELLEEIPGGPIRPLHDRSAPDTEDWDRYTAPFLGKNWLEAPWFFVEHYLYRRIMEAVRFFETGFDPFLYEKRRGLKSSLTTGEKFAGEIDTWPREEPGTAYLQKLIFMDLWGNQADLSLWPADGEHKPNHSDHSSAREHILVDDSCRVIHLLDSPRSSPFRMDIILDNAGLELVVDLLMADFLLSEGWVDRVHLHLKAHPTFVSDAVLQDLDETLAVLEAGDHPHLRQSGKRLAAFRSSRQLVLKSDFYWNSPRAFWDLPQALRTDLQSSRIVISKGDANYRRLLGDRHWDYSTPFEDILGHLHTPLLALRTLKAEVAGGIPPSEMDRARSADPDWMVNGRWGLIQLSEND